MAQRQILIHIGEAASGIRHEKLARQSFERPEQAGVVDPIGAQLPIHHVAACAGVIQSSNPYYRFWRGTSPYRTANSREVIESLPQQDNDCTATGECAISRRTLMSIIFLLRNGAAARATHLTLRAQTGRHRRPPARWQSGYAEDCKSSYVGSIPARASSSSGVCGRFWRRWRKSLQGPMAFAISRPRRSVSSAL